MQRFIITILFLLTATFALTQNRIQEVLNDNTRPLKENIRLEISDFLNNQTFSHVRFTPFWNAVRN